MEVIRVCKAQNERARTENPGFREGSHDRAGLKVGHTEPWGKIGVVMIGYPIVGLKKRQ
jgi:hypothetical protein